MSNCSLLLQTTSTCRRHTGNNEKTGGATAGWRRQKQRWNLSVKIRRSRNKDSIPNLNCRITSDFIPSNPSINGEFQCGIFHIRQQFSHELRCNYKLCKAQLKVEDVRVSEQTSTAVCQRASVEVEAEEWNEACMIYVMSSPHTRRPHLPLSRISMHVLWVCGYMCVFVCLLCLTRRSFSYGPPGKLHPVAPC